MEIILLSILAGIAIILSFFVGKGVGTAITTLKWKQKIPDIRKQTAKQSRAVIGGQVAEQMAPYLPDFPCKASEVRFIGKPVDFIAFIGMDDKRIEKVQFIEVKTGSAGLSKQERYLKEAIQQKRVEFIEYRKK